MCGESWNVKKNSNENQVYELAINRIDINYFYSKIFLYNIDAKISYNKNISTIDCLLTNLLAQWMQKNIHVLHLLVIT